jgi:hypothetical protein
LEKISNYAINFIIKLCLVLLNSFIPFDVMIYVINP